MNHSGNFFIIEADTLTADEFIALSKSVGWGAQRTYDMDQVKKALIATSLAIVIRGDKGEAIACGRAFSDDLLMTFIPDIFVDPKFQKRGLGRLIMERFKDRYGHTIFFFGAQPGNEDFFEKLGFSKSMQSYTGRFRDSPFFS